MSSEELDKLFRDKLEGLAQEPGADAWSSVQTQLGDKKGMWFYMRIAAALLLLITFGGLYFLNTNSLETPDRNVADQTPVESNPVTDTVKIDSAKKEKPIPEVVERLDNTIAAIDTSKTKKETKDLRPVPVSKNKTQKSNLAENVKKAAPKEASPKVDTTRQEPLMPDVTGNKTLVAENKEDDATSDDNEASTQQKEAEGGSTLVFDIEDFNVKTAVTSAYEVAEETKKSGFKKVLDFVKSVKEGEAGLGGLREAKNDLLSIKQKDKENDKSK